MTNFSDEKKLSDSLLDIEGHGFKLIKQTVFPTIILYIALYPQSAAVFIIEYFKFDPQLTLITLKFSLPILVGLSAARIVCIFWYLGLQYITILALIVILSPVVILIRILKRTILLKILDWLEDYQINKKIKPKKERKYLLSNIIISSAFIIALYSSMYFENPVSKLWNTKYNKKLEIIANLHYYCQITGSYNDQECLKWKKNRKEFNGKL